MERQSQRKHVVVLGAAGFVGQACMRALARRGPGCAVTCLVRRAMPLGEQVRQIVGDLREFDERWLPDEPHVIVHLAVKQIDLDGAGFHEVNVAGTRAVLDRTTEYTVGVVYNSSMSVYGAGAQVGVDEGAPCRPATALARSRRAAEELVLERAGSRGSAAVSMRPRFVIGRGDRHVLPGLMGLARRRLTVNRGEPLYSVIHVDDYADVILALCDRMMERRGDEPAIRGAVNVGYERPLALGDMMRELGNAAPLASIPVSASLVEALRRIPSRSVERLAARLELVGLSHYGDTTSLRQLVTLPSLSQPPIEALRRALEHRLG